MNELKPCPYTDGEIARKLRSFKGICTIPGLDDLILWAADIIDRRLAPENKPLTLDQLRQMDGEPVYCIGKTRFDTNFKGWKVLVKNSLNPDAISFTDNSNFLVTRYGEQFLAYARKPEQEAAT